MFLSLAIIFLVGLALAAACGKLKLPSLIAFLAVGIVFGPYVLNLIDIKILNISYELRKIALIIILTRAGLALNIKDIKRIGRPALLMCFVPALFEMAIIAVLAPALFKLSYIDALILGSVLAAVSPAIIVPRMIKMMDEGIGTDKGVPQLIMAGASVDDILVIALFTSFTGLAAAENFQVLTIINIPLSIILGVFLGVVSGLLLVLFFKKVHLRDSVKVIILLSAAFLFIVLEDAVNHLGFGVSAMIAIMTLGIVILSKYEILAKRLSQKYSKLWIVAEILLFVLVGAAVDINLLWKNIGLGIVLLLTGLFMRMMGVIISLINTHFNAKEKLFCSISYTPKATVQAAIGGIPLAMGLASGNLILSLAVLSIVITAPLGAFLIDFSSRFIYKEKL